jgi:hypothetical protein
MHFTFDRSPTLRLALVAHEDLSQARYVALEAAPPERRHTSSAYLQQLHAIANGVPCGLMVRQRMPFNPEQWEVLARL